MCWCSIRRATSSAICRATSSVSRPFARGSPAARACRRVTHGEKVAMIRQPGKSRLLRLCPEVAGYPRHAVVMPTPQGHGSDAMVRTQLHATGGQLRLQPRFSSGLTGTRGDFANGNGRPLALARWHRRGAAARGGAYRNGASARADLFQRWGYELVITPHVEFLESLLTGSGQDLTCAPSRSSIRSPVVRWGCADITPQVARVDAHTCVVKGRAGCAMPAACCMPSRRRFPPRAAPFSSVQNCTVMRLHQAISRSSA